jgi:hypothetical protein
LPLSALLRPHLHALFKLDEGVVEHLVAGGLLQLALLWVDEGGGGGGGGAGQGEDLWHSKEWGTGSWWCFEEARQDDGRLIHII